MTIAPPEQLIKDMEAMAKKTCDTMYMGPPPMIVPFDTIADSLLKNKVLSAYNEYKEYSFAVTHIDNINFNKIADDLSYADPLRIVEHLGNHWAVVHHTVYDKYKRSELYGTEFTPRQPIHVGIMKPVPIYKNDIKGLVNCIRKIKQAKWTNPAEKSKGILAYSVVTVTKVNV